SWRGGHNIGASRAIALVHVRFRTENLFPTTERVIPSVVVVVGALSVVNTARSGRASGGNAAAIPHLSAAPFHISLGGNITAMWHGGHKRKGCRGATTRSVSSVA